MLKTVEKGPDCKLIEAAWLRSGRQLFLPSAENRSVSSTPAVSSPLSWKAGLIQGLCLPAIVAATLCACTQYHVAPNDGGVGGAGVGSGGATASGGNSGVGGATTNGAGGKIDAGLTDMAGDGGHVDAPIDVSAPSDAGPDVVADSGSGSGQKHLGDTCSVTAECSAGTCVDSHCCASSSCGTCSACTGAAGTCANVGLNSPDVDSCNGVCDGNGGCKPPGSILWARSTSNAFLLSAIEGLNGVVVTGSLTQPAVANLGGANLMSVGATDTVLAQFGIDVPTHLASNRFGGSTPTGVGAVYGSARILDASGANAILTGVTYCDTTATTPCTQINLGQGLISPGGGPGADGFVGRYAIATGVPTWVATLQGPSDEKITAATNGPNGTIFISGWYSGDVTPQNATLTSRTLTSGMASMTFGGQGNRDILIAQLNPTTGAIGMTKTFAGTGFEEADTIAWTGSEIVVAGFFAGPGTDFGVTTLHPTTGGTGAFDIWVAKLNPTTGAAVWAVPLGSTGDDKYPSLVVDAAGDIYVTGFVGAMTTLGSWTVGGAGGQDIFVAKLRNSDGSVVWAKSFGSAGDDSPSGIAMNASGHIVVAGDIAGPLQPGGSAPGGQDAVIASFAADGTSLWTKVIGTSGTDYAFGVASGNNSFYALVNPGADIGPSVEGVTITGPAAPQGLLLKILP